MCQFCVNLCQCVSADTDTRPQCVRPNTGSGNRGYFGWGNLGHPNSSSSSKRRAPFEVMFSSVQCPTRLDVLNGAVVLVGQRRRGYRLRGCIASAHQLGRRCCGSEIPVWHGDSDWPETSGRLLQGLQDTTRCAPPDINTS